MSVRLLLVNPKFSESFWSFRWALERILPGKRALNPPLGLATLAALTPPDWQVEIVDENIERVPLAPRCDIVGVCGMGVQFPRQQQLLAYFRRRGYYVVAGGSYASLCPERYAALADTVIAGEAEYIWPEFCRDYAQGAPRRLYRESGVVAMSDSPVPRFDLLKLDKYTTPTLQFSRGCPYRCEFCDIIVMFGRRPRWKTLAQVGTELDQLRMRGIRNVFFVDDNLIGNRNVAKELLRFLRDYQREHDYRFGFGTEASLNLAQDTELLRLFREANFIWLFIGIESPDPETLRAAGKTQNLHEDILTSVRRIYSYGVDVLAGFIVGFDRDTLDTFEHQYRFIRDSGIQAAMVGLLTALPKTPLHRRLEREGRLIGDADGTDNTRLGVNFVPKQMRSEDMVAAYIALYRRLLADRNIAQRVRNKLRYLHSPVYRGEYSAREQAVIIARLLARGVLPGGAARLYHFLRSLPWLAPAKLPLAIVDWIAALAMRDYVERRFVATPASESATAARLFDSIRHGVKRYVREGAVSMELQLMGDATPSLRIRLTGRLDRDFFVRGARRLKAFLEHRHSRVALVIEQLQQQRIGDLQRLLRRLARYGDRIDIVVGDALRQRLEIDSSVFNLVLDEPLTGAGR